MTKYELKREIHRLCREVNKTIGTWKIVWWRVTDGLLAFLVIIAALLPALLWSFFVVAIVHFIIKWW